VNRTKRGRQCADSGVVYLTRSCSFTASLTTTITQAPHVHSLCLRALFTHRISNMTPKTRSGKEVEAAATILMDMAEPRWNSINVDKDKENMSEDAEEETTETLDQQIEPAKVLPSFGQAAGIHLASPSQSSSAIQSRSACAASSQPVSTTTSQTVSRATSRTASVTLSRAVSTTNASSSTPASTTSLTAASTAALTAEQRTLQQARFAMTTPERAALGLKSYCHYDLNNNQLGILWQTKNENRTFRQSQRRQGAVRLRAGTTTGLKFPRRRDT